jgi:signal transduction histidine kinase
MTWRFSEWRFQEFAWRLLPGIAVASGLGLLAQIGAMLPMDSLAYNLLFHLRGPRPWDDRIVLIKIDDTSIRRLERFPWSRRYYTQLLDQLQPVEPSVISFDLIFSESSPDDARFAAAIERQGHVVLGQAMDAQGLPLPPVPLIQEAAIATGHVFKTTDWDGVTRRVSLQSRDLLNLGAVSTQAYSLVQEPVALPDLAHPFWINWPGKGSELEQYSFVDVIEGQVDPEVFRQKLVFVGVTATGFDTLVTPFDRNPPLTGVYLHAAIANNLLQQNALQVDQSPVWVPWLLLSTPLFGLLLSYWRTEAQLAIGTGIYLTWLSIAFIFFLANIWIPVALPTSLIIATTVSVALWERVRMNFYLQKQVSRLWERYVPDLLQRLPDLTQQRPSIPCAHPASLQTVAQLTHLAESLGRSQSTQAAIAEHLSLGLVAADTEGIVWFCNPIAMHHLNVKIEDQLETILVPNWFTQDHWQAALQALKQDETAVLGTLARAAHWLNLRLEPLYYSYPVLPSPLTHQEAPNHSGFLLVLEDVTLQHQIQANLARQVAELGQIAQLKDDFLSTVSHELRTPITNMRLAIQMLQLSPTETQRSQYLGILEQECLREQELINDLLDLQRLEEQQAVTDLQHLELQIWLPEALAPFYNRVNNRQQRLFVEIDPRLPTIVTEEKSLKRIVAELMNNACKYTPPLGQIEVCVEMRSIDPEANPDELAHVDLIISNFGAEIPAEALPHLFDKFYRVPSGDPWKQGGTGLGLALVKRLVERLEGEIFVKSENTKTIFRVELPYRSVNAGKTDL